MLQRKMMMKKKKKQLRFNKLYLASIDEIKMVKIVCLSAMVAQTMPRCFCGCHYYYYCY